MSEEMSVNVVGLIVQARAGDRSAREQLAATIYERLLKISRLMLRSGSQQVRRWEQTEDLAQSAWFRVQRVLDNEQLNFADEAQFYRFVARHLRFEMIELYRKHKSRHGSHQTRPSQASESTPGDGEIFIGNDTLDPKSIVAWGEFHAAVEDLPEREKEVIDLIWYQGLKQQEAAELLDVDVKTIKRRWRDIKLKLSAQLDPSLVSL